jgi:hypothetical protein
MQVTPCSFHKIYARKRKNVSGAINAIALERKGIHPMIKKIS